MSERICLGRECGEVIHLKEIIASNQRNISYQMETISQKIDESNTDQKKYIGAIFFILALILGWIKIDYSSLKSLVLETRDKTFKIESLDKTQKELKENLKSHIGKEFSVYDQNLNCIVDVLEPLKIKSN